MILLLDAKSSSISRFSRTGIIYFSIHTYDV